MGWGYDRWGYGEYVPVARKKALGAAAAKKLASKEKREPQPVVIEGRKIAKSFWGVAWCDNLQAYSDFANRLPRGATYVRNGSVADLVIERGRIRGIVGGSSAYTVTISIEPLGKKVWEKLKYDCSSSIDSLFDLLSGKFSDGIMKRLTVKKDGLFPVPKEIKLKCSCPDYSFCCKHIAAVMYGVGARLDHQPELLFLLRGVDHQELVTEAVSEGNLEHELSRAATSLDDSDLSAIFGIDLSVRADFPETRSSRKKGASNRRKPQAADSADATAQTQKQSPAAKSRARTSGKSAPKSTAKVTIESPGKVATTRVAAGKTTSPVNPGTRKRSSSKAIADGRKSRIAKAIMAKVSESSSEGSAANAKRKSAKARGKNPVRKK